jgi:hypothetical protein
MPSQDSGQGLHGFLHESKSVNGIIKLGITITNRPFSDEFNPCSQRGKDIEEMIPQRL